MAATITPGYAFGTTEQVTAAKLASLGSGTISGIVNAEIDAAAGIVDTKLAQIATASKVHGTSITGLASVPAGAGVIPVANLGSGTPSALNYLRGDGAWTAVTSGVATDGTANTTNLLANGSFEAHSAGTSAVPDGFALEGTPTLTTDTGDVGYGSISQKITAAGAGLEGIKYTLSGLKASTTYSVSWRTKVTAGDTSQVLTTGAGTDLTATESTSTTFETKTGTFITDASGTSVVLKFMAKADGDVVWFDGIQVNEGSSAFAFAPKPAEEGVWADYSATSTITGFSSLTTSIIRTKKIGNIVFVNFYFGGTSNSANTSFTLPYAHTSATSTYFACGNGSDSGTDVAPHGAIGNNIDKTLVTIYKTYAISPGDWTASGAKGMNGHFFYEAA